MFQAALLKPGIFKHINCRNNTYPRSTVVRFPVPDEFVFWSTPYDDYQPVAYTASHIKEQPWADPDVSGLNQSQPKWNQLEERVNRISFHGEYKIEKGLPLNPFGRTGVIGRGLLGRWGPNHAADPVVTRWKRNAQGEICKHTESSLNILQMISIQRQDNKMWAIPGGMVDPGEKVSETVKREFMEEALNSGGGNAKAHEAMIKDFFTDGREIYKGYVDDWRNTDNAWMETVAFNFHDDNGNKVGQFPLTAGDDAANVTWMDIDRNTKLFANHIDIVKQVVEILNAHW